MRSVPGVAPAGSCGSRSSRTGPHGATSARTAPCGSSSSTASRTCRCRCGRQWCCATTPTSASTRSRRCSARAPTPSRRSSRRPSTGCVHTSPSPPIPSPRRSVMLEPRFEDLIRQTLRDEAAALPMSVTIDVLERRLADRRRARGTRQRWVGVAAATVLAVGATAGIASWVQDNPSVTSTPLPSVSTPPSPTLPDSSELLTAFPEAVILLDANDGPIAGQASPDPAASPVAVDAGTVTFDGPFVIGLACVGGGEMVAEVRTPSFGDVPYTSAVAPCDGTPTTSTYAAPPIDPDSPGDTVTVVIPPGRAWRLAIEIGRAHV